MHDEAFDHNNVRSLLKIDYFFSFFAFFALFSFLALFSFFSESGASLRFFSFSFFSFFGVSFSSPSLSFFSASAGCSAGCSAKPLKYLAKKTKLSPSEINAAR